MLSAVKASRKAVPAAMGVGDADRWCNLISAIMKHGVNLAPTQTRLIVRVTYGNRIKCEELTGSIVCAVVVLIVADRKDKPSLCSSARPSHFRVVLRPVNISSS